MKYVLALSALLPVVAVWVTYRQLVQRKRLRELVGLQRARAQKLHEVDALKSRLLTNVTHEFRTPLTLIKAQLKRLDTDPHDNPAERIDAVVRHADRLEQLIDQLLDLSRLKAGRLPLQLVRKDVMAFLRVTVLAFESLAANREVELEVVIPDQGVPVWLDADVLEKIVGNLLSNAVKYTPAGGRISVWVQIGPEVLPDGGPVEFSEGFEGLAPTEFGVPTRDLTIAVTNSGAYLEPDVQEVVFERFYRASTGGGSGVGLALVKELVEWVGGNVGVSSCREQGTCFMVRIPTLLTPPAGIRTEPASGPVTPPMAPAPDRDEGLLSDTGVGSKPRVLIVEDHAEMREFICSEHTGEYRALEAENGSEGLDLAIAEIPDLVLSDVMMPGMNGFELCRLLKTDDRTSHIPVILLTALSEAESRHQELRDGADAYLAERFESMLSRLSCSGPAISIGRSVLVIDRNRTCYGLFVASLK